ncbi:MAG: LysM peptidoglycan-binding domain-containing protein [Elusimicrobia bacterium]|nr:LysM peptidoglycan-binding domain-containing protein [Elusimicrobiota bacterium]
MLNAMLWALLALPAGAERKHKVVPKDCMWDLAQYYYKDPFKWRKIADANPPPDVRDPHWIYPDQILIIPDLDEPQAEPAAAAPEEAATTPAEAPAPEPPPPPLKPVDFQADKGQDTVTVPESLSTRFPDGLVSAPPSNYRMMALPNWSPDGSIVGFNGTEIMAAEGDAIDLVIEKGKPASGDRYEIYRRAAPTEADVNKTATYVVKIGMVQVRKPLGGNRFRAVILKSNDSIQIGDLIVKGG